MTWTATESVSVRVLRPDHFPAATKIPPRFGLMAPHMKVNQWLRQQKK